MSNLLTGIVANLCTYALVATFAAIARRFDRTHPVFRQIALIAVFLVTVVANVVLYFSVGRLFPFFSVALLVAPFATFWSEIKQFWDIGLIGADRKVSTGIDYVRSLKLCNNSLSFLGVGASKLTDKTPEFEDAMQRCNRPNRPIRFLLCRPNSEILKKSAQNAARPLDEYENRVRKSLRVIADLRNRRQWNIDVRFYDEPLPLFRLMFVDDWLCLASHYVFGEGDGSEFPQLHVRRNVTSRDVTSLYHPFWQYFEQLWGQATPWDFIQYVKEDDA